MSIRRILVTTVLLLIAVCVAQEIEMSARPIRPEFFDNANDIKNYVAKIKELYAKAGPRFGKRFSPAVYKMQKESVAHPNWQSVYDLIENYQAI